MKRRLTQQHVIGAGLLIAVVLSMIWDSVELSDAQTRIDTLVPIHPSTAVHNMRPTTAEQSILGEALALKQLIRIRDERFLLTVIDGTRNRQAVHDPKHCFYSDGWQIAQTTEYPVPNGVGNQINLERKGQKAELLFWYTDGATQHASPVAYWFRSTLRRLTLGLSGEEQILIQIQKVSDPTQTDWTTLFHTLPKLTQI